MIQRSHNRYLCSLFVLYRDEVEFLTALSQARDEGRGRKILAVFNRVTELLDDHDHP